MRLSSRSSSVEPARVGSPASRAHGCPGPLTASQNVGEVDSGLMEELRKRLLAVRTKLGHHLWPSAGYLCADVLEDGGLSLLVQDDLAPRGQEREARSIWRSRPAFRRTRQSAVADVEPELLAMMTDEVECGQHRLVTGAAQTATQLLQEDRRALGRPQEQDGVDVGQVEAFVEQSAAKRTLTRRVRRSSSASFTLGLRGASADGAGRDAGPVEDAAMYSAWATSTQKPSARMSTGSITLSRSCDRTIAARASLPV